MLGLEAARDIARACLLGIHGYVMPREHRLNLPIGKQGFLFRSDQAVDADFLSGGRLLFGCRLVLGAHIRMRIPDSPTDGAQKHCSEGRTDEPAWIHKVIMMTLSYDDIITETAAPWDALPDSRKPLKKRKN